MFLLPSGQAGLPELAREDVPAILARALVIKGDGLVVGEASLHFRRKPPPFTKAQRLFLDTFEKVGDRSRVVERLEAKEAVILLDFFFLFGVEVING